MPDAVMFSTSQVVKISPANSFEMNERLTISRFWKMPLFDCCGGCISLKEATLIIAVLDLLANIPLVVQSGVVLAALIQGRINHPEEPDSGTTLVLSAIGFIASLTSTILTACLFHGARKKIPCLMTPWIIWTVITFLV